MNTNNSGELRELTSDEAATVEGGWGTLGFYAQAVRSYAVKELGYTSEEAAQYAVSMTPELAQ